MMTGYSPAQISQIRAILVSIAIGRIGYLREHEITITWIPAAAALQARATEAAKTVTVTAR
jgi:hypothetical protein